MGKNSKIAWTDHTFNPWVGCQKVSVGCVNCYAEEFMTKKPQWANTWGPSQTTTRIRTGASNWKQPLLWDREAVAQGRRARVFCASLADVFEDNDQVIDWRFDLWDLIELTPNLDWLLLTKRPENIKKFMKRWESWEKLPENIWIGTTAENQEQANKRIPELLKIPATVRFLSCEPLLGEIDLYWCQWCGRFGPHDCEGGYSWARTEEQDQAGIDWVIVGGESGSEARPFHLEWADDIIYQCKRAGIACFVKQLGSKPFLGNEPYGSTGKGDDIDEWRECLRVREFPEVKF